jgi:hypothetical protein
MNRILSLPSARVSSSITNGFQASFHWPAARILSQAGVVGAGCEGLVDSTPRLRFLQEDGSAQATAVDRQEGRHLEHHQDLVVRRPGLERGADVAAGPIRVQVGAGRVHGDTDQLSSLPGQGARPRIRGHHHAGVSPGGIPLPEPASAPAHGPVSPRLSAADVLSAIFLSI